MKHGRLLIGVVLLLTLLSGAGCGSSSSPKAVHVSLLAPTDGAKVAVSRVFVTGSVEPSVAKVAIAGREVPNHSGHFGKWITLRRGVTHLRIDAHSPGLAPYRTEVTVASNPPARRPHHHVPVPVALASARGLGGRAWSPAAERVFVNACVLRGAPQGYCECALPYVKRVGSPLEIAESDATSATRRRAAALIAQAIELCG